MDWKTWINNLKKFKSIPLLEKDQIIYEYLYNVGMIDVAEIFKKESQLDEEESKLLQYDGASFWSNLLENFLENKFDDVKEFISE